MTSLRAALISVPGLGGLAGAMLLAAVMWFFVPLLGVRSLWLLILLTALPILVWVAVLIVGVRRRQKRDAALVAGATEVEAGRTDDDAAAAAAEDERAVSARLKEALLAMKAAGGNKSGYLYERPWYVFIGPPGSGKTTAIRMSGLEFPLAGGKLPGVGGTRNCDWWISDQAVLIDTAGRYTTQDSDSVADKAGWERFLDLLRRERPLQPLNGIIVAFGADLLSRLDAAKRQEHAQAVRRRVRELESNLGQRLPVYFLVTKADLLLGFSEFFEDLDREGRGQVWGFTLPGSPRVDGQVDRFDDEFKGLTVSLQNRLLARLQAERGTEQRAKIAGFSTQFASLQTQLAAFVKVAFGGSNLDPAPFLRGVYFASGTQEGTPIDRLTGALARVFGLKPRPPAATLVHGGRSYFLGRLFRDVVFNEARLAALDRGKVRRGRFTRLSAWTAALLAVLVGSLWGWSAIRAEADRARNVAAALGRAEAAASGLPLDRVSPSDNLARMLPYLDSVRGLSPAAKADGARLGLSQQDKLMEAGTVAYGRALDRVLLPRLLTRLEGQIRTGMQQPPYLYEATRTYLMLGRLGPLDREFIKSWMAATWERDFPGAINAPTRDALTAHLDALLNVDFKGYPLDGALVDQARRVFSRLPLAERVYSKLRTVASDIAPWRPADALGPAGQRLFALASRKPLAQTAVPGLFTVDGFHRALLPRLPQAIKEATSESWVLGPVASDGSTNDPQRLEAAVLRLYADEYVRTWQSMLNDLTLVPFASLTQAADALNLLGAPNSPMRDLLVSITRQLTTRVPPTTPASAVGTALSNAASAAAAAGSQAVVANRVAQAFGGAPQPSSAAVVADVVDERFRALREVSGPPLNGVMLAINDLYAQVSRLATTAPGSPVVPTGGLDPGQRLAAQAQLSPEPLARWLVVAAQSSGSIRAGGARAAIAAASAQLTSFCRGVEARFPFRRDPAAPDMPMDDFARLFSPGGVFDQFFAQNLRNYVDTNQQPWKPFAAEGVPAPVSQADIAQFQRAASIRDAFFPPAGPGGSSTGLRFELHPLGVDAGARSAAMDVDGVKTPIATSVAGGKPIPLQWPSRGAVLLTFDPMPSSGPLVTDGPWAALKFVARGRLTPGASPDRMRLSVQHGERSADFELRAASIVNPFSLRDLSEFRCPRMAP